jgi:hypothetical protein
MNMVREGKSVAEMRRAIDEKYGFLGKGTDTPKVQ